MLCKLSVRIAGWLCGKLRSWIEGGGIQLYVDIETLYELRSLSNSKVTQNGVKRFCYVNYLLLTECYDLWCIQDIIYRELLCLVMTFTELGSYSGRILYNMGPRVSSTPDIYVCVCVCADTYTRIHT